VNSGVGIRFIAVASIALTLGACEGMKKQLGMTKQSPDEFRVVARAPLTLPPDFTLRPPDPGAVRPQEGTTAEQAREAVLGASQTADKGAAPIMVSDGMSAGQRSLLKSTGADDADPKIRAVVDSETNDLNAASGDLLEYLVFWREKEKPGLIVDANAESKRLQQNMALGKDITTGETPTIERRKKALFEGLF
jgi:hypothetical protein